MHLVKQGLCHGSTQYNKVLHSCIVLWYTQDDARAPGHSYYSFASQAVSPPSPPPLLSPLG